MTVLAVDIGGTHARFALVEDGVLTGFEKRAAADFPTLVAAMQDYCVARDTPPAGTALIATAAQPEPDGVWRFTNLNRWTVDREALFAAGWHTKILVNDFAASAFGAVHLAPEWLTVLKSGTPAPHAPRAILGPGTGLGLALAMPLKDGRWHIQETFGGHSAAAAITAEQAEIIRLVRDLRGGQDIVVPEDLISGRSLPTLYHAAALFNGRAPRHHDNLLAAAAEPDVAQALRLFHEFLGLFAQSVAVTANAFGGLYLDGGLIQRLCEADLFDANAFLSGLAPPQVAVVREALLGLPVWLVSDPFVALRGLLAMDRP